MCSVRVFLDETVSLLVIRVCACMGLGIVSM
jgi:hypothetical protein